MVEMRNISFHLNHIGNEHLNTAKNVKENITHTYMYIMEYNEKTNFEIPQGKCETFHLKQEQSLV